MSFLAPFFLFAGLAIAVPILVHLRRRKTKERFAFPSLMFLEEVPHATIKRRRLRDLLLLALRSLAVLLLALAFAQPALRSGFATTGEPTTEVFILVDRSASMTIGDRWNRAKELVQTHVQSLGPGDAVTLALFDETVELPLISVTDVAQASRVLDETEPRDRRTLLASSLRVIRPMILDLLGDPLRPSSADVVIVSDFQRNSALDLDEVRLPAGAKLTLLSVGEPSTDPNRWVRDVELHRGAGPNASPGRERVRVSATLGQEDAVLEGRVRVSLWLDGREMESKTVTVTGRSTAIAFEPIALDAERVSKGEVRVEPDYFADDDVFYFTASAADALTVLVVEGRREGAGLFVQRALESLEAPRYRVERTRRGEITTADLQGKHVVVLQDAGSVQGSSAAALQTFVEAGGGVLVAYGRESIGTRLPAWLDLRANDDVKQSRSGIRLVSVARDHPVFRTLDGGDWGSAPFFRHFELNASSSAPAQAPTANPAQSSEQGGEQNGAQGGTQSAVLARFDNGDVALAERRLGEGRVIAVASTLDTDWNDFPRQGVFLGWLDRSMQYLGVFRASEDSYTVGQPSLVEVSRDRSLEWVLQPSDGEATHLRLDGQDEGDTAVGDEVLLNFEVAGHNSLRPPGTDVSSGRWFAANLDRSESELMIADLAVLEAQLKPDLEERAVTAGLNPDLPPRSFWWLVLYALLLLLVSEGFIASRLPARTQLSRS